MDVVDLPISQLVEAWWNPNRMDPVMLARLKKSITRFDLVDNLVVRKLEEDAYEVLSGNQRLRVLKKLAYSHVPCVVVDLDDADAAEECRRVSCTWAEEGVDPTVQGLFHLVDD